MMTRNLFCFVLVLAACAPTAATKASTSTRSTSQQEPLPKTATTINSAAAMGKQLGAVALDDPETQVIAKLGRPSRQTIVHGIGSPRWEYDNGYVIEFGGLDHRVRQIYVQAPAVAATGEGFTLGDTESAFRSLYAGSQIQEFRFSGDLQLQVATSGKVLIAGFGVDGRSQFVLLNAHP